MKQKLSDQKNATIYQYQLVKKVVVKSELILSHLIIAAIFLGFQILIYGMDGLFSWLFGFAAIRPAF